MAHVAKTYIYAGGNSKGLRLDNLPPEAWTVITGQDTGAGEATKLRSRVAWLFRCVELRAQAVASMPFEIRKRSVLYRSGDERPPRGMEWLVRFPALLKRTEAAAVMTGRAYWEHQRNAYGISRGFQWMLPSSVKPRFNEDSGELLGFDRNLNKGQKRPMKVEDVIYFWPPDDAVETGPAENYPGKAAAAAAGVLGNLDNFLSAYFERGMIRATLLTYTELIDADEQKRAKEWWQRVVQGVKNAFVAEIVRSDVKPVVIGEGVKDLENQELTASEKEDICTAMGVPQSKVTANAANFATRKADEQAFIQDTIVPEWDWIAACLNEQLFEPAGLFLLPKPENLPVMQEDENERAQAWATYVNAGMPKDTAAALLGLDVPEGYSLFEPSAPEAQQQPTITVTTPETPLLPASNGQSPEYQAEAARFRRWAGKRANPDPAAFTSTLLTNTDKAALLEVS